MATLLNTSWNVGNYEGSSSNAYTFRVEVILNSQDVATNTSNITIKKYIKGINTWSWYGYPATDAFSGGVSDSVEFTPSAITVNGKYQGEMYNIEKLYHTWTGNIAHNNDGTKTLSFTNTFTPTGAYSAMPASNTKNLSVTLEPITRESSLAILSTLPYKFSRTDNQGGLVWQVTSNADFYHTLTWTINSQTTTVDELNEVDNTTQIGSISNELLAGKMSLGATSTGTLTLSTYSDSAKTNLIGTTSKTFTVSYLRRPSDIWFTMSSGSIILDPSVSSITWGAMSYGNYYHRLTYSLDGRGAITINSVNGINNSLITGEILTSDILNLLSLEGKQSGKILLTLKTYSNSGRTTLIGEKTAEIYVSSAFGLSNITFNGLNSLTYNMYVSGNKAFDSAERRYDRISIPGRNGDLLLTDGSFRNVEVKYEDAIVFETYGSNTYDKLTAGIRQWLLSSEGYCRLEDTYNLDEYRMAQFLGPINFDTILLQAGKVTLTFDSRPERFLKDGDVAVSTGADGGTSMSNPTGFPSRPLIKIVSANGIIGTMSFDNPNNAQLVINTNATELYIDCEERNCYSYNALGEIQNENKNVVIISDDNDYPLFGKGDTDIEYDFYAVDDVVITPRWWRL